MTLIVTFATFAILGTLMLFTPLWGPGLVFARLRRPKHLQSSARFQFTVLDMACLFVYLAIANSPIGLIRGDYNFLQNFFAVFMLLMTNLFAVLLWTLAFRFANSENVRKPFERTLILIVFFPVSVVAVAQVALVSFFVIPWVLIGVGWPKDSPNDQIFVLVSCMLFLFGLVMIFLLRRAWVATLSRTTESSDVSP